jgi:RNA polymerase sigma-70 factor (ECF subfamily)
MTRDETDAARLEALWDAHHRAVLAYGHRRASGDAAAEIVAEVFATAWRRIDEVPTDARPWLLGVARRVLANQRRAEARRHRLLGRLQGEARSADPAEALVGDPAIRDALARLTAREREALLLIAWDELTTAEAAAVCGCTETAFRVRLHRARRRFAEGFRRPGSERLAHEASEEGTP